MVTTVVALLAPLFWPGFAATRRALHCVSSAGRWRPPAWRRSRWASSVRHRSRPGASSWHAQCCTLVLILTHALAAMLEGRWRRLSADAQSCRELAGRTVVLVLALLGSLPLWLGPAAELLSARHDWVIDATLVMSPSCTWPLPAATTCCATSGSINIRTWPRCSSRIQRLAAPCLVLRLGLLALATACAGVLRPRLGIDDATRTLNIKEKTRR